MNLISISYKQISKIWLQRYVTFKVNREEEERRKKVENNFSTIKLLDNFVVLPLHFNLKKNKNKK